MGIHPDISDSEEVRKWREIVKTQGEEIERLKEWINDLQAGMYINCVYCGHRYGPDTEIPASMADVLKEHIEKCPKHPLFKARQEIKRLEGLIKQAYVEGWNDCDDNEMTGDEAWEGSLVNRILKEKR